MGNGASSSSSEKSGPSAAIAESELESSRPARSTCPRVRCFTSLKGNQGDTGQVERSKRIFSLSVGFKANLETPKRFRVRLIKLHRDSTEILGKGTAATGRLSWSAGWSETARLPRAGSAGWGCSETMLSLRQNKQATSLNWLSFSSNTIPHRVWLENASDGVNRMWKFLAVLAFQIPTFLGLASSQPFDPHRCDG